MLSAFGTCPRRPAVVLALFALSLLAVPAVSRAQETDRAARIDELVSAYHDAGQFNGSVLVAENAEIIYENGFGWANVEWNVPNTPDTKHRIGSVTKQFTSALILQLVEEGKIELDGTIIDYVPDYPAEQGSRVTIHHLLNHTSGIPSYTSLPEFGEMIRDPYEPDSLVAIVSGMDLQFDPGSKYAYNNSGYFLLGLLIEKVTGRTYDAVLEERILGRLGLDDSGYDHYQDVQPHEASGYTRSLTGLEHAAYLDTSLPFAAGMMYSTVRDLYRWDQALYEGAVPFEQPETKELWFTPGLSDYAYGWVVHDVEIGDGGPTVRVIEHGGGINGFSTTLRRFPDQRNTVIVIDNTEQPSSRVASAITAILYGQEPEGPKPEIARAVVATFVEEGAAAGIAEYRRLKAESPDGYNFAERQLNNLGYHFLRAGDSETAIAVFQLNVEQYPDAFNTYDSLGEAYMEDGQAELAVANYERSIELNPGNDNGREMLRRLGVEVADAEGLELPEALLERYVGDYELQPGFVLSVTREGGRIFVQATGQPRTEILARSDTRFFLTAVAAQIEFHANGKGPAEALTLFQGGREMRAPRVE